MFSSRLCCHKWTNFYLCLRNVYEVSRKIHRIRENKIINYELQQQTLDSNTNAISWLIFVPCLFKMTCQISPSSRYDRQPNNNQTDKQKLHFNKALQQGTCSGWIIYIMQQKPMCFDDFYMLLHVFMSSTSLST